jgi:hypothetical protein
VWCLRRLTIVVIAALAVLCPTATTALGAGSPLGYAVSAVGFRSYFVFDAKPGKMVAGRLRVVNLSSTPRTIELSPADVSTAAAGGLQYGEGAPRGEARWVSLSARTLRLAGSGAAEVPFTVRLAGDARPGDHLMAIVAIDRRVLGQKARGRGAIRLRLIPRLAMTIQVRVPGPARKRLAVGNVSIAVAPSGATLAIGISNPGERLIDSTGGDVRILQGGTPLFNQTTPLAAFAPRTSITYHVPWEGTPVEGTYRVQGTLRPQGAPVVSFDRTVTFGSKAISQYRRQTGRQAKSSGGVPFVVVVALALAVVLAVAFGIAYTRARRALRNRA